MRLFVAINFPAELRDALHEAAAPLRAAAPDANWVAPDRLHLTVRFLGDQAEAEVPRLERALAEVAARHAPFDVALGGAGAFPNLRRPRVVWIGMDAAPRLELVQHDVETALAALGHEPEGRPFRPHVTLGRLRGTESQESLRALARAARQFAFEAETRIDAIDLMHSTLGSGGPVYRRLVAAALVTR